MSFEPDTNDIIIRQLREEISRIREEGFARALPTNVSSASSLINSDTGVPTPFLGVASIIPSVIRVTKDTGIIDKINFDNKSPTKDFSIGETITGNTSGATAEIGDIDTLSSSTGTLILVPGSISGTFQDGENLNGSIGGTNIADADGTQFTQTGRGHLNAGAGSIIAQADATPREIHFIDNAQQDGQIAYLRAQDGQTIRMRRPLTNDATTGNLDIDESFDIVENALLFFQYQVASNASPTGGWVPILTGVSVTPSGTIQLPLYFDKDDKGDLDGTTSVAIDLSANTAHTTKVRLVEDPSNPGVPISQTIGISGAPPSQGVVFFLTVEQDSLGGHTIVLPSTVSPVPTIDTSPNAISTIMLYTQDGGSSFQSMRIIEGAGGDNLGNHMATQDLDMKTFNIINLDVLKYAKGNVPGADSIIGFSEYGSAVENDTKLKWSIPGSEAGQPRFYEWQVDLAPIMQLRKPFNSKTTLDMFSGDIQNTTGITFDHTPLLALSGILPNGVELRYDNGFGSGGGGFHGFHVGGSAFAQWEIREDVNRSNVNLDVVTNDIINIDQAQFDQFGGFVPSIDHGERRITGGSIGMVMNIPKITPSAGGFEIWFENDPLTSSTLEYRFDKNSFDVKTKPIEDTLGLNFTNGGSLIDTFGTIEFNASLSPVQTILVRAGDGVTLFDLMEFTGTEMGTNEGGVKLFTDLNFQTQDATNVDRIHFNSNNGIVGGNQVAIAGLGTDMQLNVPSNRKFDWRFNTESGAELVNGLFRMLPTIANPDGRIQANQFEMLTHSLGTGGMIDGMIRLVNTGSQNDIIMGSGGSLVNISTLASGGADNLGNHIATQSLDMSNFSIINFVGWIGGVGQAFTINPGNFTWDQDSTTDFYQWRLGGIAHMTLAQTNLDMHNKQITAVVDPLNPQDVATKNYVDTELSSVDVSQWSTFPAVSPVNLDSNPLANFTSWTNGFNQSWIANSSGLNWFIPSGDVYLYQIASAPKFQVGSSVSDFFTQLDMNNNKIVNVPTPTNANDVTNKDYVDSQASGVSPGDNVTWTGDHTFNGSFVQINSSVIQLGNSTVDSINVQGQFSSDLVPITDNLYDFGRPGERWREAFFSSTVNAGSMITTGDIIVGDDIEINGDLNHDGPRIGFFGVTPDTQQPSGGFVSASATLQDLKNAHNIMRASLVTLGLLAP